MTAAMGGPDKPDSGWHDYEPRQISSSPLRERRRARRTHIVVASAIAILIVVAVVAGILVSRTLTSGGGGPCSPAPCADDGSGFQVIIDSVSRNVAATPPVSGDHIVRVTVDFLNRTGVTRTANPLDFRLEDPGGQTHDLVLDVGAQCGIFEALNIATGSTVGPKAMCFLASGDPRGRLTLLWTPQTRQVAIDIP
jgi:hypothetical protein